MHEDALAGVQLRAASVLGSFDPNGHYASSPAHTTEYDLEQDVFGAVRLFDRAQIALLVPIIETRRATPTASEFGGGLGDVNLSVRYDIYVAGKSRFLPGVALLAGVTFPTGTPVESATKPLATDSTGVGAFQGSAGVAFEQTYGPWLFNVTGIAAKRFARTANGVDETLGTQLTALVGTAYSFDNDAALAVSASYTYEGDGTIHEATGDVVQYGSARRVALVAFAGVWPISDHMRVQGSIFLNPPISGFGANLPATTGFSLTGIRSW
jgi:hypothetical protein